MKLSTRFLAAFFAVVPLILPASAASAQLDCNDLGRYRDGPLFQQWNTATQKANIYAANHADVVAMRNKLLSDATWQTSDWLLLTGLIASNIKTTTDLIGNLAAFAPAEGAVTGTAAAVKRALEGQELGSAIQEDGALTAIGLYVAAEMNPVGKAAKTMYDLGSDVHKGLYLPSQRDELKQTIREQLDKLDAALARNNANYVKWASKAEALNRIRQGIDSYALAHCQAPIRRPAMMMDAAAPQKQKAQPAVVTFDGRQQLSRMLDANWGGPLDQPLKNLMLKTWPMSVIYYLGPTGQGTVTVDLNDARWTAWDKVAPADAGQSSKYGKIFSLEADNSEHDGRHDDHAVFCRLAAKFRGKTCK